MVTTSFIFQSGTSFRVTDGTDQVTHKQEVYTWILPATWCLLTCCLKSWSMLLEVGDAIVDAPLPQPGKI